jgi:uridine kinase
MTHIIGVSGGSASGKTTFCKRLIDMINNSKEIITCDILSMDCYYKTKTPEELECANNSKYDFDNPNALDLERFSEDVNRIKNGEIVDVYDYDYSTHTTSEEEFKKYAGKAIDVLFVEGIHVFQCPDLFDIKIFVDVDSDERLCRRIERDIVVRKRTLESVLLEWKKFVKPNFDNIIFPTKKYADVIVPHGADNQMCLDMVKSHIIGLFRDDEK